MLIQPDSNSTAPKPSRSLERARKLVLGNWKLHGSRATNASWLQAYGQAHGGSPGPLVDTAAQALQASPDVAVGVAAPYPYLDSLKGECANLGLSLGAQDVSPHASGAYTGEVSAAMLAEFGAEFALVGHSERRQYHFENSTVVLAKMRALLALGLTPVMCIGETLEQRDAGSTFPVLDEQLQPLLTLLAEQAQGLVLAYEPVWAIGTGRSATPLQAQEVHAFLRQRIASVSPVRVPILYGGSVKADNAAELFAMPDIDGALVGGASLSVPDFLRIISAARLSIQGSNPV